MSTKLKVGVVGTGKHASYHVKTWNTLKNVTIIGIHGSNAERLNYFAKRHGIACYQDYGDLVQRADIIDIVSQNHTHSDYAFMALKEASGIIIEKPLDIQYEKAQRLYRAAKSSGTVCSVVSQFRFHESFKYLKRLLDEGVLGDVEVCKISIVWPRDEQYYSNNQGWRADPSLAGGGVLIHQCIHFIDLACWFFGNASSVCGRENLKDGKRKCEVERSFWGEIEFVNGVICQIYFSTNPSVRERTIVEISGSKGMAMIMGNWLFIDTGSGIVKSMISNIKCNLLLQMKKRPNLLKYQLEDFVYSVLAKTTPRVSLKDGLIALKLVMSLYHSAQSGRRLTLQDNIL